MSFRRRFQPVQKVNDYRQRFVIAIEGDATEKDYFNKVFSEKLKKACAEIVVIPSKSRSDANSVCSKLIKKRNEDSSHSQNSTQYWMVVDRDQTPANILSAVEQQCHKNSSKLCMSNPSFEFWLLLHFEDGNTIQPAETNSQNLSVPYCLNHLRSQRYLQMHDKYLSDEECRILSDKVYDAIRRAEEKHTNKKTNRVCNQTGSTVYLLAKELKKHIL